MRQVTLFVVFILLVVTAVAQEKRGPSTPEERERAVKIAHQLESNPLDKSLNSDADWLLKWAADVPDIHVSLCASHGEFKKKFKYGPQTTFQKLASATAFVIEHPEQANDSSAQELAAVNGALNAYEAILKVDPKGHSEYWDALLKMRSEGTLKDFVAKYVTAECTSSAGRT